MKGGLSFDDDKMTRARLSHKKHFSGPLFVTLDIGEELKNCNEEERINMLNPLVNDLSIKIEENVENNSHRR